MQSQLLLSITWRRCSSVMVNTAWLRLEWRFMPVAAVARISVPCTTQHAK